MKQILGQCSHFMILFETALFRTAVPAYAIEYSHFHRLSSLGLPHCSYCLQVSRDQGEGRSS